MRMMMEAMISKRRPWPSNILESNAKPKIIFMMMLINMEMKIPVILIPMMMTNQPDDQIPGLGSFHGNRQ